MVEGMLEINGQWALQYRIMVEDLHAQWALQDKKMVEDMLGINGHWGTAV
jgi:hypothetical protein